MRFWWYGYLSRDHTVRYAVRADAPCPRGGRARATKKRVRTSSHQDHGRHPEEPEERDIKVVSSGSEYIPQTLTELSEDHATEVLKLIDRLEQDDDERLKAAELLWRVAKATDNTVDVDVTVEPPQPLGDLATLHPARAVGVQRAK